MQLKSPGFIYINSISVSAGKPQDTEKADVRIPQY